MRVGISMTENVEFFSKMKVIVGVQSVTAASGSKVQRKCAWRTANLTVVKSRQAQLPE